MPHWRIAPSCPQTGQARTVSEKGQGLIQCRDANRCDPQAASKCLLCAIGRTWIGNDVLTTPCPCAYALLPRQFFRMVHFRRIYHCRTQTIPRRKQGTDILSAPAPDPARSMSGGDQLPQRESALECVLSRCLVGKSSSGPPSDSNPSSRECPRPARRFLVPSTLRIHIHRSTGSLPRCSAWGTLGP